MSVKERVCARQSVKSGGEATKRPNEPSSMRPDAAPGMRPIVRPPWTLCDANVASGSIGGTRCVS